MERLTKRQKNGDATWNRGPDVSRPGYTLGRICEKLCKYEEVAEELEPFSDLPRLGEKIFEVYTYEYAPPKLVERKVRDLKITDTGIIYIGIGNGISINSTEIGETLFLTREDAEEKIRKLMDAEN